MSHGLYIPIEIRFWKHVNKTPTCWLWNAYITPFGYGVVGFGNRSTQQAHRVSWMINKGEIPNGMCVLHKCDVRNCVNPDHLWLGTRLDNNKDAAKKGRSDRLKKLKGEAHSQSKLTEKEVIQMRKIYSQGLYSTVKISNQFKISPSVGYSAIVKKTWKHI